MVRVATPPTTDSVPPTWVGPEKNFMEPVADVATPPPAILWTVACMVTGVPASTGPGVVTVRSVVVGVPGGGGSGSVPCRVSVITLPTLPA